MGLGYLVGNQRMEQQNASCNMTLSFGLKASWWLVGNGGLFPLSSSSRAPIPVLTFHSDLRDYFTH